MTPPDSVRQQFIELRNRLAAEKAPANVDSAEQAKVYGWTTESRYVGNPGSKALVARAVMRSLAPALRTGRVSVMPLCALPQRGVVPDVSGNPAVIMKLAEEDCKGDRCLCQYVPTYWPFLLRCCLRIVTHKYVNTNVPLAEQVSGQIRMLLSFLQFKLSDGVVGAIHTTREASVRPTCGEM